MDPLTYCLTESIADIEELGILFSLMIGIPVILLLRFKLFAEAERRDAHH